MIDAVKQEAIAQVRQQSNRFQQEFEFADREAQESQDRRLQKLREEIEKLQRDRVDDQAELQAAEVPNSTSSGTKKARSQTTKMARERNLKVREIERKAAEQVTKIQNQVKVSAVAVPGILPLVVGCLRIPKTSGTEASVQVDKINPEERTEEVTEGTNRQLLGCRRDRDRRKLWQLGLATW